MDQVIDVNIGYKCNMKCKFCISQNNRDNNNDFIDKNRLFIDLQKYLNGFLKKNKQIERVNLLGGEVTLLPYLFDLLDFLNGYNLQVIDIVTNGVLLSNYDFVNKLIKRGVNSFNLSIHSYIPKDSYELYGQKGLLKKKIEAVRNLNNLSKKNDINYSISCVLNELNYDKISDFISFFSSLGFSSFNFNFMHIGGGALNNFRDLGIKYSDLVDKYDKWMSLTKKKGVSLSIGEVPFCVSGVNYLQYINFFENKNYKNKKRFGKTDNQIIGEVEKEKREKHKIKLSICDKCFLNQKCEGFWLKNYDFLKNDIYNLVNKL